jgi:hypothetical protein
MRYRGGVEKLKTRLQISYYTTGILHTSLLIFQIGIAGTVPAVAMIFFDSLRQLHPVFQFSFYISLGFIVFGVLGMLSPIVLAYLRKKSAVYFTRRTLPDFEEAIKNADRVWGIAYNAVSLEEQKMFDRFGKPQELIVINPDGEYREFHQKLFDDKGDKTRTGAIASIARAENAGVWVGKYDGAIPFSMLIFNPESHKSLIQLEIPVPGVTARERPIILVDKHTDETIYNSLFKFYTDIRATLKPPS